MKDLSHERRSFQKSAAGGGGDAVTTLPQSQSVCDVLNYKVIAKGGKRVWCESYTL